MKKSDKLTPIVTLVIYYGEKPWDAAKSLYDMMELPDELRPFVNNHFMNLIELRNSKLNFLEKEGLSMCTLFEEIKKEGKLIGKAEGELIGRAKEIISLGREFGLDDEAIILKLQERLDIDAAKSREYFEQFN